MVWRERERERAENERECDKGEKHNLDHATDMKATFQHIHPSIHSIPKASKSQNSI